MLMVATPAAVNGTPATAPTPVELKATPPAPPTAPKINAPVPATIKARSVTVFPKLNAFLSN